jgi:micrococcal nuclease
MRFIIISVFLILSQLVFAQKVKVTRVVDGDTYVIETGEKVRMIGIDAPEMSTDFGNDAKEHLKTLIEGKTIELQPDKKTGDKDRYNRLLRYAILNGEDINLRMVCDGFAIAYTKFKFSKAESYTSCQINAEGSDLGMWLTYDEDDLYGKSPAKKKSKARTKNRDTEADEEKPVLPSPQTPSIPYTNYVLVFFAGVAVSYIFFKLTGRVRR